jgi:phospholipase C
VKQHIVRWLVIAASLTPGCSGSGTDGSPDAAQAPDGSAPPPNSPPPDLGSAASDLAPTANPDLAPAPPQCPSPPLADPHADERAHCAFSALARVDDTLGLTPSLRQKIPITHLVIVTEENRSFDHFFGQLHGQGQPAADGWPANFSNPDNNGTTVSPYHLTSTTLPADPPHQGAAMSMGWDNGQMDGFVRSAASAGGDGHFAMGYYDQSDLPFLYWLANTFAIADRYFAPALGGTWANRDYLYAATSHGVYDTGQAQLVGIPNIFDALDHAHVTWGVYSNGTPRQDCLGWDQNHNGVFNFSTFQMQLSAGTLPTVSFVDPTGCEDTHPTNDIHGGETWLRAIYEGAIASPLWGSLAVIFTFDEAGGLADHVAPPPACPPSADQSAFNRYGVRIPAIVISPYARAHYVSHAIHDHTSILRLVEVLADLPALTARDANADALLDLFDFACPSLMTPATAPQAGFALCI